MRTTLTLDDDVAVRVERLRKRTGQSLKDVVNAALREGLDRMDDPPAKRRPFRTTSAALGALRVGSLDNVAEVLAIAEGEAFR